MRHHAKLFMVVLPHNKSNECLKKKHKEKKQYYTAEKGKK